MLCFLAGAVRKLVPARRIRFANACKICEKRYNTNLPDTGMRVLITMGHDDLSAAYAERSQDCRPCAVLTAGNPAQAKPIA